MEIHRKKQLLRTRVRISGCTRNCELMNSSKSFRPLRPAIEAAIRPAEMASQRVNLLRTTTGPAANESAMDPMPVAAPGWITRHLFRSLQCRVEPYAGQCRPTDTANANCSASDEQPRRELVERAGNAMFLGLPKTSWHLQWRHRTATR